MLLPLLPLPCFKRSVASQTLLFWASTCSRSVLLCCWGWQVFRYMVACLLHVIFPSQPKLSLLSQSPFNPNTVIAHGRKTRCLQTYPQQEFSIEIPDKDADQIHSVDKAVEYILSQPDAN